jgi:hypothetical protein
VKSILSLIYFIYAESKNGAKIKNLKVFCYFFENSYPKVKISSLGSLTEKRGKKCALFAKIRFFPKLALITLELHHLWSISHLIFLNS